MSITDVKRVILNAYHSNFNDMLFNLSRQILFDSTKAGEILPLDHIFNIARTLSTKILRAESINEFPFFIEQNYVETSYYLYSKYLQKFSCDNNLYESVLSLKPVSMTSEWHRQSIIKKHNEPRVDCCDYFLSQKSFENFAKTINLYSSHQSPIKYIFGSLVGISNGHILYLMPSIHEKICREILCLQPVEIDVFVDLETAANKDVLLTLQEANLIRICSLDETCLQISQVAAGVGVDGVALSMSCKFLNNVKIPNIYYTKQDYDIELVNTVSLKIKQRLHRDCLSIPQHKQAVLFHNRDSGYKVNPSLDYRNSNPNLALNSINNFYPDHKIYRLGVSGRNIEEGVRIDYDKNNNKHQIDDTFLLSISNKYVGTSSGPGHYAHLFLKDVLLINCTSFALSSVCINKLLVSLRHINSIEGKSPSEKILRLMGDWAVSSIKHRELDEIEIQKDLSALESRKSVSIAALIPHDVLNLYPYVRHINLTPRCYENLSQALSQ